MNISTQYSLWKACFITTAIEKLSVKTIPNLEKFMPGVKKTYLPSNEANIVQASGQHLIYPVNVRASRDLP